MEASSFIYSSSMCLSLDFSNPFYGRDCFEVNASIVITYKSLSSCWYLICFLTLVQSSAGADVQAVGGGGSGSNESVPGTAKSSWGGPAAVADTCTYLYVIE